MALNTMGLGFMFTGMNLAKGTFKSVQRDLITTAKTSEVASARITKSMAAVKAGFLLAGAGALGLMTSFKLAGAAGEFEMGLAGVGAVARATESELKALEARAIRAGIETQFSPTEAIEGLRNLAVQGFTADEAMTALGPSLDLAAGGQISVAQATATSAAALRAFGLQAARRVGGRLPDGYAPGTWIQEQLRDSVAAGHDVQLHLHPQWTRSSYDPEANRWTVDPGRWRTGPRCRRRRPPLRGWKHRHRRRGLVEPHCRHAPAP